VKLNRYIKGFVMVSVPFITKPWCISSEYKIVQPACSAADTIMASNNCKSYFSIILCGMFKVLCKVGTMVHFSKTSLHLFNNVSFGIFNTAYLHLKTQIQPVQI
jgi:hypothetical protein